MTLLASPLTVQDRVDQFEQVIFNKKGKFVETCTWSQIQILVKKLQALCLRKIRGSQKKDCCREPKKTIPQTETLLLSTENEI